MEKLFGQILVIIGRIKLVVIFGATLVISIPTLIYQADKTISPFRPTGVHTPNGTNINLCGFFIWEDSCEDIKFSESDTSQLTLYVPVAHSGVRNQKEQISGVAKFIAIPNDTNYLQINELNQLIDSLMRGEEILNLPVTYNKYRIPWLGSSDFHQCLSSDSEFSYAAKNDLMLFTYRENHDPTFFYIMLGIFSLFLGFRYKKELIQAFRYIRGVD